MEDPLDIYNHVIEVSSEGIRPSNSTDDLDEYGRNVNQDESSILDLFKDNVPKSKEGIDKSQPFIPTRASDCPFNPDGRNHEFIKDQNSDVTCKHCGEEVTDYEVKLWGEAYATEGGHFTCPNCGQEHSNESFDEGDGNPYRGSIGCGRCGTRYTPMGNPQGGYVTYVEGTVPKGQGSTYDFLAKKYGWESKATESQKLECPNCGRNNGMWRVDDGSGDDFICVWCNRGTTIEKVTELNNLSQAEVFNIVMEDERNPKTYDFWNAGESKANELSPESQCPKCGSYKTILEGMSSLGYGKRRQYVCTNCYNVFQSEHSPKEIKAMYRDGTSPYDRNRYWGESKASEGYVVFTSDGITQERHKEEWEAKDHAERIGGYVQKEISDDDWDLGKHYSISRDGDLGDIVYDALGIYDYANEGWDNQDPPRNPNFDRDVWVKKWGKDQMDYKHGLGKHTPCTNCDDGIVEMPDGTKTICSDCGGSGLENTWQGESKYTIEDESDQNDGEIQKDIESELHGEEKYVRGYENDWEDKLDTWDGRAVSDNFTTVQPYDPVNPKYECIYCNKEFSWDDTFTHDGSHGTLPSPYEDMGNT